MVTLCKEFLLALKMFIIEGAEVRHLQYVTISEKAHIVCTSMNNEKDYVVDVKKIVAISFVKFPTAR